jgi:hypothetical protein
MNLSTRKALITLAFLTLAASPAAAMPGGFASNGPNCAALADVPVRDVWLGHFAGGRWTRDAFGGKQIDWRDDHVCFISHARCQMWQRSMGAAFSKIGGYRTCVRIR